MHCHVAEPRGRDGKAVEVKSAGGVSPPAGGGGGGGGGGTVGLPRIFFEKKNGAIWCALGAFLNALKHHVYGALKSFFTAPPPIIRPLLEAFLFFKTSSLWGGEIMSPPPPSSKKKKKR